MSTAGGGSVTRWLGDLKTGGDAGAQQLWERYFDRLVRLARDALRSRGRDAAEDEEDAALSAFDSFCRGAALGRFPRIAGRDDLWRLLVVITVRKAIDQAARRRAAKRGGGRRRTEADLARGDIGDVETPLDLLAGGEPDPEMAAMVAEEYLRLRQALGDDSLRRVLDLRLEGRGRAEIAANLGCTERTVTRKLDVIRRVFLEGGGS
ncbi:MAG TPA: ECF-type sigma factor [Isosphaeraceae bacterium]|jgi:RNA polymerase sigma factor (sigma-70 family)|nr:ECF-type sigma factor [Isosphaeraceae bacterium]